MFSLYTIWVSKQECCCIVVLLNVANSIANLHTHFDPFCVIETFQNVKCYWLLRCYLPASKKESRCTSDIALVSNVK